ncbi:MAG: hypothetical protein ACOCV1_00140 [Bacillota bacterium]
MKNKKIFIFLGILILSLIFISIFFGVQQTSYPASPRCEKKDSYSSPIFAGDDNSWGFSVPKDMEVNVKVYRSTIAYLDLQSMSRSEADSFCKNVGVDKLVFSGRKREGQSFNQEWYENYCWQFEYTEYFCPECIEDKCKSNKLFRCSNNEWESGKYIIGKCDVVCIEDDDCGSIEESDNYCKNGDVYKTVKTPICDDYEECKTNERETRVEDCKFDCLNGLCTSGDCFSKSDCGEDGYIGEPYCDGDNAMQKYRTYFCEENICSYNDEEKIKQTCEFGCNKGVCEGGCVENDIIQRDEEYLICKSDSYYPILDIIELDPAQQEELLRQIEELELTIDEKARIIEELTTNLDGQILMINQLEDTIEEKAQIIKQLELKRDEQVELINRLQLEIDENVIVIEALESTLERQGEIIDKLDLKIEEQVEIIKKLRNTADEQAVIISGMEKTITEQAELISELTQDVEEQAEMINQLTTNLQIKAQLVQQLQAENEKQAELIKEMEDSFDNQAGIISNLRNTIEDDAEIIQNLHDNIDDQAEVISRLKLEKQEMALLIEDMQLTIDEQADLIEDLRISNEEKGELIAELKDNIEEQASLIEDLRLSLKEKGEIISGLKLSLEEERELINEYKLTLDEQAEIISGLKLSLEEERQLVSELRQKVEEQQELLEKIKNAKSADVYEDIGYLPLIIVGIISIIGLISVTLYIKRRKR